MQPHGLRQTREEVWMARRSTCGNNLVSIPEISKPNSVYLRLATGVILVPDIIPR